MRKNQLVFMFLFAFGWNENYAQMDKVWEQMESNNYDETRSLLKETSSTNGLDCAITEILLNEVDSDKPSLAIMKKTMPLMDDVSPYLYSLWFTPAVSDGYGKKDSDRLSFLNSLYSDDRVSSTVKGGIKYILGHHYIQSNNMGASKKEWAQVKSIISWQFAGVFDNTSGSGFDKNYDPITKPEPSAVFKNKNQANVNWFTPIVEETDPWISFNNIFDARSGVVFSQTFIQNDKEEEMILALGGQGNFKVWINDILVISAEEERVTEMDNYKQKIVLPAGNNRVLVQLGFTKDYNYPNFLLRFLDLDHNPITRFTVNAKYSDYNKGKLTVKEAIPHFAEAYFENKIKAEPENIVNHILLAKCYNRAKKNNDAIEVLKKARDLYPSNIIVNYELMINYQEMNDRTELLKQVDYIRTLNTELLFINYYDYLLVKQNGDLDEMQNLLGKMEAEMGEDDITILEGRIDIVSKQQDYMKLTQLIDAAYKMYPNHKLFVQYKYIIEKKKNQGSAPTHLIENFLKKNYDYEMYNLLIGEYNEAGKKKQGLAVLKKLHNYFPRELDYIDNLLYYSFESQDFTSAKMYVDKSIGIAPYRSSSYMSRAYVNMALGNKLTAISDLERVIELRPNSFDARERLRELNEEESLITFLKNPDTKSMIQEKLAEPINSDENFQYVFFERNHMQFNQGSGVQYTNIGIRILNESGVERWQQATVPVNNNWENLTIENAVVYTKNGQKFDGERNYNQIVFPSLSVGDIIHFEYRKDIYTGGQLAEELWLDYCFSNNVLVENAVFRLFMPKDYNIKKLAVNMDVEANEFEKGEFKCWEWKYDSVPKIKDEFYMPSVEEVGKGLNFSTVLSWNRIAQWYRDIALPMAKEDYNLNQAYSEIFDGNDGLSELEKHHKIYNYLCDNINYSSVSFRQSNYVPQKPMVTLSTNLGDCKDMSVLYHTLARKAGLTTNLVLVNTRNNGENDLKMPSTEFNHCIVRTEIEGKEIFLELTDKNLPFGAMPNTVLNSQALIIPNSAEETFGQDLIHISDNGMVKRQISRKVSMKVEGDDLSLTSVLNCTGQEASKFKSYFMDLSKNELTENINSYLSKFFENDFEVVKTDFSDLKDRTIDFEMKQEVKVLDMVKSLGSMRTFKVNFFEVIASLEAFPNEERNYNFEYWRYEPVDFYDTEINITVPDEFSIIELPTGLSIDNEFLKYELTVTKIDDHNIKVTRTVTPNRKTFPAASYVELRNSVKNLLKAEDMYIVFK